MILKKGQRVLTYLGVTGTVISVSTALLNWYKVKLDAPLSHTFTTWMEGSHIVPIKDNPSKTKLKALHKLSFI
jgi:preprotein translocase subunit YajC